MKQDKEYWSDCGMVYFVDDKAWGLDKDGKTWCLGKEPDVIKAMETGEVPHYLTPKERQSLSDILELRKEILRNESKEYTPRSSIRGRLTRTFKRKQANSRQAPKRRKNAIYKVR
jgi:hypothetical protein